MTADIGSIRRLLGPVPPSRFVAVSRQAAGPHTEELELRRADGIAVRGLMVRPPVPGPHPVIVYIHAHGGRFDIGASELIAGRPALQAPYAPDLVARGFAALCIDLPCFGLRAAEAESAAAKRHLWHGTTLFGEMLADLSGCIDWLATEREIDAGRIGALGLSMGATLGYWLAAIDQRIAAVAHLCCFCDLETLVQAGAHDAHGIYMSVPGLLPVIRTGELAGLVAPRPQLACMGSNDPLTPPDALARGVMDLIGAYARAGAEDRLTTMIEPVGHTETPAMRAAVLAFFGQAFGREASAHVHRQRLGPVPSGVGGVSAGTRP